MEVKNGDRVKRISGTPSRQENMEIGQIGIVSAWDSTHMLLQNLGDEKYTGIYKKTDFIKVPITLKSMLEEI